MIRLDRFAKTQNIIADLARAAALVWKAHPGYTLVIAFLTVVQGVLPAARLWATKLLIDQVVLATQASSQGARADLGQLLALVGVQAGLALVGTLLSTFQGTVHVLLGELLSSQTRLQVFDKTNEMELAFFENEQFYNKLQNAYQEASTRPLEIVRQLFSLGQTCITSVSIVFLLSRLHWGVLLLIVITTLPVLLVHSRYGHRNYWMLRQRAPELRKQHYLGMLLTSDWFIKEIRVFQLEGHFSKLYKSLFKKFFQENQSLIVKRDVRGGLAAVSASLGWFLAVGYVVFRAVDRAITIGDFALYTQTISMAQGQVQAVVLGLSTLYSNALFLRNLFEFLSLPGRDLSAGLEWTEPITEIAFRNVSFCYPGTDRIVLHNVNFKLQRGQSLALVGKNGAGKTTIVKLLCRLYEPTAGQILVNNKDIAAYSPRSVQEQIAVLFQDYGHYQLSARENIGVGRLADLDNAPAIETAAQKSGADEFIQELPTRYNTMLGRQFEGGVQLSIGQWQKVALARAFLRQGQVLILDEPTASLDAEAEFEVFETLLQESADQIALLISHRFSTVRMADHILVLEEGKCTEAGSHEDLMQAEGHYARLFKLQAKGYAPSFDNRDGKAAEIPSSGELLHQLAAFAQERK